MATKCSIEKKIEIFNKTNGKCIMCKKELTTDYSFNGNNDSHMDIEHALPKCLGGGNHIDNLFPSCKSCNSKKQATLVNFKISNISIIKYEQFEHIENEARYEISVGAISKKEVKKSFSIKISELKEAIEEIEILRRKILS